MSGATSTGTGGAAVNVAQLLTTLAPLFLGAGNKTATTTTGGSTATTRDSGGTTTSTSKSSGDAGAISSLQGVADTAGKNAVDTTKTDTLVADILRQSAQAFAPVIAQQGSSGLYNSSTLSLLSSEARARATSASSKAVLDYQSGQQQIQSNALANLVNATKTTTTESTVPPSTRTTETSPSTATTVNMQAPTIDPISSLLTLGGGTLLTQLLKTQTAKDLPGQVGGLVGDAVLTPATDALGLTSSALRSQASLISPTTNAITGVKTGVDAIGVGENTAGVAVGANAFPTSTEALLAGGGSDVFTADTAALAAQQGGNLFSFGNAAGAGADALTSSFSGLASDAFSAGANADIAASLADTGFSAAGGSADLLASGGASILGHAASIGQSLFGSSAGPTADAVLQGTETAIGAGVGLTAAAGAAGAADLAPILLAALAWIICTELKEQGKMSPSLYRYGARKFQSYPEWGKRGYLLWATPVRDYIRKKPSSKVTAVVAKLFNLRVNNIASRGGCRFAKWTVRGAIICGSVNLLSASLGLLLFPFLSPSSLLSTSSNRGAN